MKNRANNKHQFADIFYCQKTGQGITHDKRDLRASGLSLLPLALRPLLFCGKKVGTDHFAKRIYSNFSLIFSIFVSFLGIFIFQTANVSAKSVTLTIPSTPLTLNVEPNSGTVFKKSSPGTISVATDSSYGYSLSIQSKTSNDLLNGSNKIASIASALSESDYKNSGDANTWAYLPSKLGGSINTDFQPGPTTEPTTLDRIESSSEGTNYDLTLAAKIDNTLPAGNYSNTFVLSATSNDPPYDDIIQNWADCDALETEQSLNLLDIRDNKIYSVAKLKDGQCWMTENLAIGKEDEEMTLTSDTSDTADDFTLLASSDTPNPSNAYDSREIHLDSTYGGYYTWFAATAGEGTQSKTDDTAHSICPKGWRLPTQPEFQALASSYSNNTSGQLTKEPANFKMGGFYTSSSLNNGGSYGYYWSSTGFPSVYPNNTDTASYMDLSNTGITPSLFGYKYFLVSVRCVARPDNPKKVGTMQTVDEWSDSVEQGKTVISEDVRDNKQYTVSRLADGRLWMTKNLEIAGKNLTSEDSDVESSFVLPTSNTIVPSDYDAAYVYVDGTYGGYYSWFTATAGEGTSSKSSGDTAYSICPRGWRLPTKQDFIDLDKALGGTGENRGGDSVVPGKLMGEPNNFKMGGYYNGNSPTSMQSDGHYWSSTVYPSNSGFSYILSFTSHSAAPQDNFTRYSGLSIRCVSRTDDPKEVGTMQTVNEWGDSVKQGKTVISEDIRDGKQYTAARLADGKLWMTKNLEIENKTLTTADSDVAGNFSLPASSNNPNSSNSFTSTDLHVDATYGGYYTWYTATAGEGTQQKSSGDVSHSICPKGWRLPTRDEFVALDIALGGTGQNGQSGSTQPNKYMGEPNNFKMGGLYSSGFAHNVGNYAYFWSSTANGGENAYILFFHASNVNPQGNNGKYNLASVRCVSRTDDPKEVGTMQTVDQWGDSVKQGKTVISEDIRDGKKYTAARLADGKLWMTKNLEIADKNLTSADSDVASTFTLPSSSTSGFSSYDVSNVYVDNTYGGYYTWFAATAGEGTQQKSSGDVSHSICPKGWKLPTRAEFDSLMSAQGTAKMTQAPASFLSGGRYYYGSPLDRSSNGEYWSSTVHSIYNAYYLYVHSSGASTNDYSKNYGSSVRCVSQQ